MAFAVLLVKPWNPAFFRQNVVADTGFLSSVRNSLRSD
jgi:hypothetical protein